MTSEQVVVIGSGPCGAMAALELVDRGIPTTLVESGSARPRGLVVRAAGNTMARWMPGGTIEHDTGFEPDLDSSTVWYRDLAPGGLSNHWTAAVPRFAPNDFGHGVDVAEAHRWPITYDDLVPHYERVERLLGVTAGTASNRNLPANLVRYDVRIPRDWTDFVEPARALGHDLVPLPMAKGTPWMVARRGTEFNSWTAIVAGLIGRPGFELITGAHVRNLRYSASDGRVDAVEYLDRERHEVVTVPARAVVVAAGALHSTKLLMGSTSPTFPEGLGNTHGVLGRYLHDHPKDWWAFDTDRKLTLPAHPVYMTRCAADRSDPLMATSFTIGLATSRDRPKTYLRGRGTRFGVQVFGTVMPDPDHWIRLADGPVDALGQRPLRIRMGYDDRARATMIDARDRLREVFADGGCTIRPDVHGDPELRPGMSVHYGGTVRMHERPEYGMLDGQNLLHAVPNVAVVDSAAFTTGPEKNPTLTAMAMAARAAAALDVG